MTPDVSEFVEREIAGLILPADVYRHAVNERPAIKAAGYRLEGSEKMLQAARGGLCSEFTSGCRLQQFLLL